MGYFKYLGLCLDSIHLEDESFPDPIRYIPSVNTRYFIPDISELNPTKARAYIWYGRDSDYRRLKNRLIHLDARDAANHAWAYLRAINEDPATSQKVTLEE